MAEKGYSTLYWSTLPVVEDSMTKPREYLYLYFSAIVLDRVLCTCTMYNTFFFLFDWNQNPKPCNFGTFGGCGKFRVGLCRVQCWGCIASCMLYHRCVSATSLEKLMATRNGKQVMAMKINLTRHAHEEE